MSGHLRESDMLAPALEVLQKLLRVDLDVVRKNPSKDGNAQADALIRTSKGNFVVEFKARADRGALLLGLEQLSLCMQALGKAWAPLLVVPFMGPEGAELCRSRGINWVDLSGNACIELPALAILVAARPNQFIRRGRPSSAFAPKSSRVIRWLLIHPHEWLIQRELAKRTGLSEALAGRVVNRLESDGLLVRNQRGAVRPRDPMELLLAWWEQSEFGKNRMVRGHVAGRSGQEVAATVAAALRGHGLRHAATGLAAAWQLAPFAAFRTVSMYVDRHPGESCLKAMGFRRDDAGANVWLVFPLDEGVFHGMAETGGMACVHAVQAYVDLRNHPERATEAAQALRTSVIEEMFRARET